MSNVQEPIKIAVDVVAGGVTVAALMEWLPPVAAALSILWLVIQIFEWGAKRIDKWKQTREKE